MKKLYIQMISVHGLVRGSNIEMGHDADTGGQVRYVVDLAQALSRRNDIARVDLFTRLIQDKRLDKCYSVAIEPVNERFRIVRLPCGGGRYLPKEKLWPHLDEFVDNLVGFTLEEGLLPDAIHGHYADAGYVASEMASFFDRPLVFTGHSLGRTKLAVLRESGWTDERADKRFRLFYRIEQEENVLARADAVITSTRHEWEHMYNDYRRPETLRHEVIAPGLDLNRFFPYYDYELSAHEIPETHKQGRMRLLHQLQRFHLQQELPLIVALCRPDRRKNVETLIEAFGADRELQSMANLTVFAGIRDNIAEMEEGEKEVLTQILLLMDRYDLYGKLAIPKRHDPEMDVPELYRLAASSGGVLASTSSMENFGLTFIEGSAVGLPFVAPNSGGPVDIVANCRNGLLLDSLEHEAIVDAIKRLLTDRQLWEKCSNNGINNVRKYYSWKSHCDAYIRLLRALCEARKPDVRAEEPAIQAIGNRLGKADHLLVADIDGTLLGDADALVELRECLAGGDKRIATAIATGRPHDSAVEVLRENGFLDPLDIFIVSVGTEIYYGNGDSWDRGWAKHIAHRWRRDAIREVLEAVDGLVLQPDPAAQRPFKISYYLPADADVEAAAARVRQRLGEAKLPATVIVSHGTMLDVLPHRASKGKAIQYLSRKWKIPIGGIVTAGNSGNDLDMLAGKTAGVVVANHEPELEALRGRSRICFAERPFAGGIIDGLRHFGVLDGEPRRAAEAEAPETVANH